MELIHGRTPSQTHSQLCLSLIQLHGQMFHPQDFLRWQGYWFTPTLCTSIHFSRHLVLAPYLCHWLATSLVEPILLCWADLYTPNAGSLSRLNTFWHKVQRWATNCFLSTPIGILAIESCLPPVPLGVSHRPRMSALRTIGSLPAVIPTTAHLHLSFPSQSSHRTPDSSRALTRSLLSVYIHLSWKAPRPSAPLRTHLPLDAVAHATITITGGRSRMPMIN